MPRARSAGSSSGIEGADGAKCDEVDDPRPEGARGLGLLFDGDLKYCGPLDELTQLTQKSTLVDMFVSMMSPETPEHETPEHEFEPEVTND